MTKEELIKMNMDSYKQGSIQALQSIKETIEEIIKQLEPSND